MCSKCYRKRIQSEKRAFAASHPTIVPTPVRTPAPKAIQAQTTPEMFTHFQSVLDDEWLSSDDDVTGLPAHMACVTRAANKTEKASPQGLKARQEEMQKLFKFQCFGEPCTYNEMRKSDPDGTYSGVAVLTSMKHMELPAEQRKYKARAVLLGDNIRRISDGKQVFPRGMDYGLHGDVSTLPSLRLVLTHALVHDAPVESVDLTSAYLQAEWPAHLPSHFVVLTPDAFAALPAEARAAADAITGGQAYPPIGGLRDVSTGIPSAGTSGSRSSGRFC